MVIGTAIGAEAVGVAIGTGMAAGAGVAGTAIAMAAGVAVGANEMTGATATSDVIGAIEAIVETRGKSWRASRFKRLRIRRDPRREILGRSATFSSAPSSE